jgi:hypothetical protein
VDVDEGLGHAQANDLTRLPGAGRKRVEPPGALEPEASTRRCVICRILARVMSTAFVLAPRPHQV